MLLKCEAVSFSRSPSACVKGRYINIFPGILIHRDGWLASVFMLHDACMISLAFAAHVTACGMMWHDSHCAQIN